VDDGHRLGLGDAVAEDDRAVGGAGRVGEPLELEAREDVRQPAVAVLRHLAGVEEVVAGGDDDVADLEGQDRVFLGEVDGVGLAELLAGLAGALLEVGAVGAVDDGRPRDGLGERRVDRLAIAEPGLEDLVDDLLGALLLADAAAVAEVLVDVAGLLADGDGEVADVALDLLDLAPGQELDVGMRAGGDHLGGQDAGRAVEGGEGLVELGHVAADRGVLLDEVDLEAGIGQLEGGADAGDAAAHDERGGVDVDRHRRERLVAANPLHAAGQDGLGLDRGRGLVRVDPRVLLADRDQLAQVRVQPGAGGGLAEGVLVEVRASRPRRRCG
jgi:hypothetical protein